MCECLESVFHFNYNYPSTLTQFLRKLVKSLLNLYPQDYANLGDYFLIDDTLFNIKKLSSDFTIFCISE